MKIITRCDFKTAKNCAKLVTYITNKISGRGINQRRKDVCEPTETNTYSVVRFICIRLLVFIP